MTLRDRFITVAKTEDDFPFQLYLRLYQDDVMYEMVNPKDSTWLCAMVLHAAEALVCRFVVDQYIVGYVEAGLSTLIIMVAGFTLYTLTVPTTKNWKVSANGEYFIVNATAITGIVQLLPLRAGHAPLVDRVVQRLRRRHDRLRLSATGRLWERLPRVPPLPGRF